MNMVFSSFLNTLTRSQNRLLYVFDSIVIKGHITAVKWEVDLHDDFVPEYRNLPKDVQDELLAHIELLEQFGPQLGRPGADTLYNSRHYNYRRATFVISDAIWAISVAIASRPGRCIKQRSKGGISCRYGSK